MGRENLVFSYPKAIDTSMAANCGTQLRILQLAVDRPRRKLRHHENLQLKVQTSCTSTRLRCRVIACRAFSRNSGINLRSNDDDDDVMSLLQIFPEDVRDGLLCHSKLDQLLEVTMDLGRLPQAHYIGNPHRQNIRKREVSNEELEYAYNALGELGGDNRAGIAGTLHRISAIKNKYGKVIGLTCRVGRPVSEQIDMVRDLLEYGKSILFLGRPGVGKTTVMRGIARVMSEELLKRVVIVDTSNEIGGDGDVPHPAIGSARRLQVPEPSMQYKVMIEAVENHMPEVIIVDEIGTEAEVRACRTIAERGVMLIGSAHGNNLKDVIKNPTLSDLIGGLNSVILSDHEAKTRNGKKSILERRTAPTFPFLIEMRKRHHWVAHRTDRSVDQLLRGQKPLVEVRSRDEQFNVVIERWKLS